MVPFRNHTQEMTTLYNAVNLSGWGYVLYLWFSGLLYATDTNYYELIHTISVVQCFAIMEPLMILAGKVKSSLATAVIQLLSRLIFPLWFFQVADVASNLQLQAALGVMCLAWSVTEITRGLFYLTKYRPITILRYNLFIVLYPMGVLGEVLFITTVSSLTEEPELRLLYILLCGSYAIFFPMLYSYMFTQRAKMYSRSETKKQE